MSGKSTLLRSIGLNIVLAQAGGVVCARQMSLPECDLQTSIRVQDSLERGLSYFMAALARLKGVVDAAQHERPGRVLVYLLDEILQGTNSVERSIAVRAVTRHLLDAGAIGAMTTHDLGLAEEEPMKSAAHVRPLLGDARRRRHDALRLHAQARAGDVAERAAADADDWDRVVTKRAPPTGRQSSSRIAEIARTWNRALQFSARSAVKSSVRMPDLAAWSVQRCNWRSLLRYGAVLIRHHFFIVLSALVLLGQRPAGQVQPRYDLLIAGGQVVDGTGAPAAAG